MRNEIEVRGETTVIFINSPKFGKLEALIDTSDLHLLSNLNCFHACKRNKRLYVGGNLSYMDGHVKKVLLHRFLMDEPNGLMIDHINHNGLDNRRSNLRHVSNHLNQQNRDGAQVNSKSGIRNVYWHKRVKKWGVQIKISGKKISCGYFENIQDAEIAAISARAEYMSCSQ